MFVAIGSLALQQELTYLKPNDVDLVAHPSLETEWDKKFTVRKRVKDLKTVYDGIEVEWARPGTSAELILNRAPSATRKLVRLGPTPLASREVLKGIMRAHLCFSVQWGKHIERYVQLDSLWDDEVFRLRQAETAERVGYKPERYRQSNAEFFKDGVKRDQAHDSLHEIFKFGDKPAYQAIKYDQTSAAIEIELFEKLHHEDKLKTIWEELLVLGWERVLSKRYVDARTVLDMERLARRFLFGMATNYLPLEFRCFVIDNYKELLKGFPYYKWEDYISI